MLFMGGRVFANGAVSGPVVCWFQQDRTALLFEIGMVELISLTPGHTLHLVAKELL